MDNSNLDKTSSIVLFLLHSDLVGVCLVICRLSKTISDLLLPVNDLQRQANAYASKHKDSPLPSERIDGDTLTTRLVFLLQPKSVCKQLTKKNHQISSL